MGHGAEERHLRDRSQTVEIGALAPVRGSLHQGQRDVAAEDRATLVSDAVGHAAGERADAGDGGDAKHDAGEEHPEAAETAAKLASREADGECRSRGARDEAQPRGSSTRLGARPTRLRGHCGAPVSISPDLRETTRSERSARATSWVISTRVVPRAACAAKRRSAMTAPVAASRLPVGSSARRIEGPGARARAMATRCCSPPESSAG